ncbi:MAG: hypothetical protein GXP46_00460 [Deferribacteres bacterium]|nr:hypothetical protein [Deferribacteres bacterium]
MNNSSFRARIIWVIIFGVAMAFVESAIVVYLRAIFYPEGFRFPLKALVDYKILVEVMREAATIFMLLSVAYLAGRSLWERFAYFMLSFGVWDIFYYVWLKVLIDWPSSIFEWDILFLIPLPWIGPVIAPVSIAFLMIVFSMLILHSFEKGRGFRPSVSSHILALAGTLIILYSFMHDLGATLHQQMPEPYRYELLVAGDLLFIAAFIVSYMRTVRA